MREMAASILERAIEAGRGASLRACGGDRGRRPVGESEGEQRPALRPASIDCDQVAESSADRRPMQTRDEYRGDGPRRARELMRMRAHRARECDERPCTDDAHRKL